MTNPPITTPTATTAMTNPPITKHTATTTITNLPVTTHTATTALPFTDSSGGALDLIMCKAMTEQ